MSLTERKIEEKKDVVLRRVPPGDRWQDSTDSSAPILDSLTDGLEWYFQKTGQTEFFLSARRGVVEIVYKEEVEVEKPIKKFSIYGED
jgi:hypothetical protein